MLYFSSPRVTVIHRASRNPTGQLRPYHAPSAMHSNRIKWTDALLSGLLLTGCAHHPLTMEDRYCVRRSGLQVLLYCFASVMRPYPRRSKLSRGSRPATVQLAGGVGYVYSHLVTDVIKPLLAGYSLTIEVQRGLHTWNLAGWLWRCSMYADLVSCTCSLCILIYTVSAALLHFHHCRSLGNAVRLSLHPGAALHFGGETHRRESVSCFFAFLFCSNPFVRSHLSCSCCIEIRTANHDSDKRTGCSHAGRQERPLRARQQSLAKPRCLVSAQRSSFGKEACSSCRLLSRSFKRQFRVLISTTLAVNTLLYTLHSMTFPQ